MTKVAGDMGPARYHAARGATQSCRAPCSWFIRNTACRLDTDVPIFLPKQGKNLLHVSRCLACCITTSDPVQGSGRVAALTAEPPHVSLSLPAGRERTATHRQTDPAHRQTDRRTDPTPLLTVLALLRPAPPRGGRAPGSAARAASSAPALLSQPPCPAESPSAPPGSGHLPGRGRAPAGCERRLVAAQRPAGGASLGSAPSPRAPGCSGRPPALRCAPLPRLLSEPPSPPPRRCCVGPGGRRHPPPPAPPPGRAAEEAAAWARGWGSGRGGKWWPGRAEGAGTGAMRLLRALRRCAAPGSIPQQVDFYSRFSPSPLSMKQFLDFGESPPGSPRPGPSAGCRAPRPPSRLCSPEGARAERAPRAPRLGGLPPPPPVSAKRCPVWHKKPRLPSWRREPSWLLT